MNSVLKIKLLHKDATIPTKANPTDAGFDLYAVDSGVVYPQQQTCISLGIAITVPPNTYGRIAPRSGLAYRSGIDVMAGVIDETYTDELKVILRNHRCNSFTYEKGDRIAQLIIEKIEHCTMDVVDELTVKSRGGGFGSTGI